VTRERWSRVKEVFQSAIERHEGERGEFVARACGADEELRGEVESLLREHSRPDELTSPVREVDLTGRAITHFRVIGKLGRGGMGVVYKAEDLKLGRLVALKFLAPQMPVDEEHRARFVREARALAAIDHPHICAVHEIDEAEGRLFLAMAFIDGPTLKEKIAGAPLAWSEALRIVADAARGLQAAHRTGVVHRDVKSANIMLDAEGRVIVTDFGLALLENQPGFSPAGMPMGTPGYMSPEQARGENGDRRSDIWSLGVVLYEAVSGRLPFPAGCGPASGADEPPPLAVLRPGVPPELDRIVRKALAPSPDERYQTAEELAVDLRQLLGQAPEKGRRARLSGRPRLAAAMAAMVLLALAGGVLWRMRRAVAPAGQEAARVSLAVLPLQNLSGDAEQQFFADGLTDAITTDLARIGALRVISRTSALLYRKRPERLPALARELQVDHAVEGSVQRAGNCVRITVRLLDARSDRHLWAQSYEGELGDVLRLQSEVAHAIAREVRVRLTPDEQARLAGRSRVNPKAYEAFLRGYHLTHKWNREGILKGREYFQQAIAEDPDYAPAYAGLADSYMSQGFYWGVSPTEWLPKAEAAAAQAIRLDSRLANAYLVQAMLKGIYRREWPEAERLFRRAHELDGGQASWVYAAYYLAPLGRLEEALQVIRQNRESSPLSLNVNVWVGWIRLFRREYGAAEEQFRGTLELDPGFGYARTGLLTVLAQQGKFQEAQEANNVSPHIEHTAWLWAVSGRRAEARRTLNELIERYGQGYIGGYELAWIHAALGDTGAAIQELEKAYRNHEPALAHVKVDPRMDPLRADPRFRELLRKMCLEP